MTEQIFDLAEIQQEPGDEKPDYMDMFGLRGYFVRGYSHMLAAAPHSGKTEYLTSIVSDWVAMGEKILWVSEEGRILWKHRIKQRPRIASGCTIFTLYGEKPDVIAQIIRSRDEKIVILDTLRAVAQVRDENDNAEMTKQIAFWRNLGRELSKTMIIVHHTRKSGGDNGLGVAGANTIVGSVDVLLELAPYQNAKDKRVLRGIARNFHVPEIVLAYDRTLDNRFVVLGDVDRQRPDMIAEDLRRSMTPGQWIKTADIGAALKISPSTRQRSLNMLADNGLIVRDPPWGDDANGKVVRWWNPGEPTPRDSDLT